MEVKDTFYFNIKGGELVIDDLLVALDISVTAISSPPQFEKTLTMVIFPLP